MCSATEIEELTTFAVNTVLEVQQLDGRVNELAEKTARALAHLAVAIVELRRPTLRERIGAWIRTNVYDGAPVFTPHTERDERKL